MATETDKPEGDKPEGDGSDVPEKPSYMTAADFNKATTAREKRLLERIEKSLDERLSKLIAARQPTAADPEAEDPDADDEAHKTSTAASTPPGDDTAKKIASLQRQLTRERNEREREKAEREAQNAKIARDEERTRLSETLAAAGVDPKKIRGAIALLHTEDKRVRRNAEGKIVFVDENDDEWDLASGIKQWVSSDEGKSYMPARGAQGSGAEPHKPPTKTTPKNGQKLTKEEAGKLLLAGLGRI